MSFMLLLQPNRRAGKSDTADKYLGNVGRQDYDDAQAHNSEAPVCIVDEWTDWEQGIKRRAFWRGVFVGLAVAVTLAGLFLSYH